MLPHLDLTIRFMISVQNMWLNSVFLFPFRYVVMGNLLKVLTCTDLEQEPNFFLDFESEIFFPFPSTLSFISCKQSLILKAYLKMHQFGISHVIFGMFENWDSGTLGGGHYPVSL